MQSRQEPAEFDLLLVGGGHSHLAVLRGLAMQPLPGVRVTLLTSDLHTPYSGMLPGHVAGAYSFDQVHFDLARLAAAAGARLIHAPLTALDADARRVSLPQRPPLRYDALSLNTGATPSLDGVAGELSHVVPVKPIARFLPHLEALLARMRLSRQPRTLLIVGGGAGGVELALALAGRLQREGLRELVTLTLIAASERLLPGHPRQVAVRLEKALRRSGVHWQTGVQVTHVDSAGVRGEDGREFLADEILWVTAASAPDWLAGSGLQLDSRGYVLVGSTLQSVSHDNVFAAGDVAGLGFAPRPKSGVYAVRAGPVLRANLVRWIQGRSLRRFRPQRRALYLIGDGNGSAVVSRPGWPALHTRLAWRWKDWIDRRFMERFQRLAPMPPAASRSVVARRRGGQRLAAGMRCAGCGSKLGSGALLAGLHGLAGARTVFEDAARLPGTCAAVFQSIDGFPLPVSDPYLGGRLAALHALSDIHAMGLTPIGALALAGIPFAGSAQMAQDLTQLMAGAERELRTAGCDLLGGHSAESDELSLALAVSGREAPEHGSVLRKSGLQPGQALVLTRPLGSGVLLAGVQRGEVPAQQLASALEHMLQSHGDAVTILQRCGATACTDVTGYGLLGHALEMAQASGCQLRILADAVPAYAGAETALAQGLESSLQRDNEDVLSACDLAPAWNPAQPRIRLLCDPQTCGGLLASLPQAQAEACVAALQAQGYSAARVIGQVQGWQREPRIAIDQADC